MLGQLVEFMDGARTAARALFTMSDVADGGYRLGPVRVRRNAAFCVPLLAYFHDAFERRSFWILGRRFSFPFLGHFRRRTSGPKRLRAPELTLVPRRTGNFITLPAGIFMRVLAEAAEVCRDTVALRRLTCLFVAGARRATAGAARGRQRGRIVRFHAQPAQWRQYQRREGARRDDAAVPTLG